MFEPAQGRWRRSVHEILFESRTRGGRRFDIALIAAILASVCVVILDSVASIRAVQEGLFLRLEWGFTLLFTLEYLMRLSVLRRPRRYALSFFGIVDLLAIVPTYLSVFIPGAQSLLVIRIVRLLRIFHVLELSRHQGAARVLLRALRGARYPISVFLLALAVLVVSLGTLMYAVERDAGAVTSIPMGMYWAVVTLTTLGYGDVVPVTDLGRALTTGIVVLGYGALAVPVGIISSELVKAGRRRRGAAEEGPIEKRPAGEPPAERLVDGSLGPVEEGPLEEEAACSACGLAGHQRDARYCRRCGAALEGSDG